MRSLQSFTPPPEKLDAQRTANALFGFFQFLKSLLRPTELGANESLQRTRPSRHCCNRGVPHAGSLSLV
jgi:hypothetical protein